MISVKIVGDRELVARLDAIPAKLRFALTGKVTTLALKLENLVKRKLTNDVLKVKTGALRRSIQHSVEQSGSAITGKVFSAGDVKYAGIHEYGGTTAPHVIEAKGKALAFIQGGKMAFYKRINHPGSKIPERSYLRSSLIDMKSEIISGLQDTVKQVVAE